MDRAVIVNSLLCFIYNYRSHPHLDVLTQCYFTKCVREVARKTLIDILKDDQLQDTPLLELFDRACALQPAPMFVAADLTSLPVVLISDQSQQKSVLDEIHQLRFYIQKTLDQDGKRTPQVSDTSMRTEKETAPESPINLFASQHHSPRSVTPHQNGCADNETLSQSTSQVSSTSMTPKKAATRKRASNRLDQAVRRLTDRLELEAKKAKIESCESPCEQQTSTASSADDTSSELNGMDAKRHVPKLIPPAAFSAEMLMNTTAFLGQTQLDQITVFLLQQSMANRALASQQQTLHLGQSIKSEDNVDAMSVDAAGGDDIDDLDKISNESSPTPSDSSNGKEYNKTEDKESGEKPFTCEQPNCNKRFANKFLLKKHQFIHTGLRPHMCPFCSKRFNRKDNLLRHKKTHITGALFYEGRRRQTTLLDSAPSLAFDTLKQ